MNSAGIEASTDGLFWTAGAVPLIAVVRARRSTPTMLAAIETMVDAGIRSIELTLTTPGALDMLAEMRLQLETEAKIGVGTIWSGAEARSAIDAGADYLVTPAVIPDALGAARHHGVPILSGAFTPTEIHQTVTAGATAVKLFPASDGQASIAHMKSLFGPIPGLRIVPSGGVPVDAIGSWLSAGAFGVSLGSDLLRDDLNERGQRNLGERCRSAVEQASAWA